MPVLARGRDGDLVSQAAAFAYNAETAWTTIWRRAGPALYDEGRAIFIASQALVPVLTGRLKASGSVFPIGGAYVGNVVTVLIGYYAPYSASVHERLGTFHKVGQAKFLELPFKQAAQGFSKRVGGKIMGGF